MLIHRNIGAENPTTGEYGSIIAHVPCNDALIDPGIPEGVEQTWLEQIEDRFKSTEVNGIFLVIHLPLVQLSYAP